MGPAEPAIISLFASATLGKQLSSVVLELTSSWRFSGVWNGHGGRLMRTIIFTLAAVALLSGAADAKPKVPSANSTGVAPSVATAPAAGSTSPSARAAAKPRTQVSLDCSSQADAKGLHGKERRKFRRECKKPYSTRASGVCAPCQLRLERAPAAIPSRQSGRFAAGAFPLPGNLASVSAW